jgi:PAS domain S-box-containing protein
MPQLVWTARPDGTVDYYNQRYTEFSGITLSEGESWQWSPVLHPDDVQYTLDAWAQAVQTGTVYEVEHRVYLADGTIRWYLSRGVPARNEKGDIIKWYGTATDIHEQKLAEERVSTILNSISDGFLTIDEDWNITYFNAAAEQILGVSAADVMGRNFWDVFPFARNNLFEERYTWAMREHKPTSFEAHYEAEPYENWYEVRVSPHGQGLSLYFQVITERKQAEELLRYQALVLENISDIVFTTDMNFRAVSWNHAAEQHYGWTADEMIGQDPAKLLHTNYLSTSQKKARQQFITTGKWVGEIERTRKDGHVVAVSASANMLYDEKGNSLGMVCVERDITEQKHIVETVQAQADLLEQTHDAIFTWGSDNSIIHWYEGATRLYGWTREEAIGQPAHELLKSYPTNDWHEIYAELRRTGRWRGEITHTNKNGERIIVESQMVLVRHSDNRELVLEINRDITERKWVERIVAQTHTKVLEQQRKLETILSTLPVGVFITDRNGQITQINKKADEIFRQPPFAGGEFKQCKGWWPDTGQVLAPEDWPAARALASGKTSTNELIDIERFDGTRGTILASAAPLQTVDGDINGAVLVVSDITERRQIEQALRESEQRMRTVLENMPVALIAMDEQQQFIAWNKECERITGYPANEIIGNPQAFELLIPDQVYREQVLTELDETSYRNWEIVFNHRDGTPRYVDWSNIADEFPVSGWASWSVGVDITERKWAEQQALELMTERERVRVLTDFVRSISHDFKTPLSTINTSTYLLRRLVEGDQQHRHVDQIQRQTSRINELLDGMLTMTRLDDEPNLILQPTNFNRMIENILIQAGPQSSRKGIALVTETTDEILLVQADEIELHRALSELVENAIQFTPDQGMITLRSYRTGSAMGFEVQDTGLGIPHEELTHIFKRLYRIDKARSTDTGGIGLGLSIAARIIELHHGSIEVESVVGEGSIFRVRLPLVS